MKKSIQKLNTQEFAWLSDVRTSIGEIELYHILLEKRGTKVPWSFFSHLSLMSLSDFNMKFFG